MIPFRITFIFVTLFLVGCGQVSNDVQLISPSDQYSLRPDRSVVIVGVGSDSATPALHGVYVAIAGDQRCWLLTNVIYNELDMRYDKKENGIKYFVYDVRPGFYYTNGFVRPPFGDQPSSGANKAISFKVETGKIVYIGDFVYRGESYFGPPTASGVKLLERDIELRRDINVVNSVITKYPGLVGTPTLAPIGRIDGWARRCGPP